MENPSRNGQHGHWVRDALDRFEAPLCRYAAGVLGDADRARDVVQDTFLRLVRTPPPPEIRGDEGRFRGWLYTVCHRRALDVRRKERRMTPLTTEPDHRTDPAAPAPPDRLAAADEHARVLVALNDLPENQRQCLRLRFTGGLSYRQIADATGLTPSHVGYLIHHGLKTLRQRLSD